MQHEHRRRACRFTVAALTVAGSVAGLGPVQPDPESEAHRKNHQPPDTTPVNPDGSKPDSAQPQDPSKPPTSPTTPTTPTTPGQPMGPGAFSPLTSAGPIPGVIKVSAIEPEEPGPYVKREKPQAWVMRAFLTLNGYGNLVYEDGTRVQARVGTAYETMTIVFPVVSSSAASLLNLPEATSKLVTDERERLSGKFMPGGTLGKPELLRTQLDGSPYHSGVWLGKWALGEVGVPARWESSLLIVDLPMTSFNTTYDEKAAERVGWPTQGWPVIAASTFAPQMYVDFGPDPLTGLTVPYNPAYVAEAVKSWLGGRDPRSYAPAVLAKLLCGKASEHFQPTGDGLVFNRGGYTPADGGSKVQSTYGLEGLAIGGAEQAARLKRGTEWDMVCLLTAAYRHCGIPARMVIGYDSREEENEDRGRSRSPRLRAWVEWYLFDEPNKTANWVPADPVRIRRVTSRMHPLNSSWKFFGRHDELRGVMPFAHHFHPPTKVRSYESPAFWGWQVTPGLPSQVWQRVRFAGHKGSHRPDRPQPGFPGSTR
ncbi:MAG: transglutaminase domain-containing protein [Phycisphaeraceae bacterium]|nr:MAG: transglutaminase domain-containing protein [Phycisphaeraceae bacterium]